MSSRALRKAQREREEAEQLQKLKQEDLDGEDDDTPAPQAKQSAFAILEHNDSNDRDEEDQGEEEEEEQLAADGNTSRVAEELNVMAPQPKATGGKKKKKKKSKNIVVATQPAGRDVDEIDEALKQLSTNGTKSAGTTVSGFDASAQEAFRLLAIDTTNLHAQNEMRRLFGRTAMEQEEEGDEPQGNAQGGNRRQQRRGQQAGLAQMLRGQRAQGGRAGGLASLSLRRNIFIQGKEEWPIATGGGLGMEVVEKHADGTVEYRYVHNRGYQDVQSQFEASVASMDPQRLILLLQHNPYHISTLLQVSEIAKQERDHATSGDLLERALFSLGRAVHSTFSKSLSEGKARLDFRRPENREFWLAAWRYMQNLSMRATWRTVYEWAKLLLSFSPQDDPYAMWLVLDQYALRARQDLDYLNISRASQFKDAHQGMPHVQLSQGLAEFKAGNKSKGRQALFTAVGRFPWAVARLMQELQVDPPPAIWGKEPRTEKEKLYSELYAARAKDLWNTPETSALLVEVASALQPETPSAPVDNRAITANEARHVLLTDSPAFIALIPRTFSGALASSSDPLPPSDNITSYTPMANHSSTTQRAASTPGDDLRELQGLYGFFSNLFPGFNAARQDPTDGDQRANQLDQTEIERRIDESGVTEEVIIQRTQRMMELQRRMLGEQDVMEQALEAVNDQDDEDNMRARVEDVPDVDR